MERRVDERTHSVVSAKDTVARADRRADRSSLLTQGMRSRIVERVRPSALEKARRH